MPITAEILDATELSMGVRIQDAFRGSSVAESGSVAKKSGARREVGYDAGEVGAVSGISVRGVQKSFGGTRALVDATLDAAMGEIHAIVGENGSGKSTLAKIISGVFTPDAGSVSLLGQAPRNPQHTLSLGVATIFQEMMLAEQLSVSQNMFAGSDGFFRKSGTDRAKSAQAKAILERLSGQAVDPEARVADLPLHLKQWVVLGRAIRSNPKVLILDESSAALDLAGTERLHAEIRRLRDGGACILIVTHRIAELVQIADRATVLRDGATVGCLGKGEITEQNLLTLMSAATRDVKGTGRINQVTTLARRTVLRCRGLRLDPAVAAFDFALQAGEIVGVAGLDGAGQTEFVRALAGIEPAVTGRVDAVDLQHDAQSSDQRVADTCIEQPALRRAGCNESHAQSANYGEAEVLMMRLRFELGVLLLVSVGASSQTIGQNKSPGTEDKFTLSVRTQLVVETVVVKDKQGNPVSGLKAEDFTLTEDGVAQKIRYCEHQTLPSNPLPVAPVKPSDEDIKLYKKLTHTQIAAEAPENLKYKDRRLLALYFDMSAMRPAEQLRALAAAEKFIRTQITEVDLVSIMRYESGSVDVLQDFTADRNKLLSILQTLVVGEGQGSDVSVDDAASADTGAAFGQDDGEFNVFTTDRQLAALQTAAKMLGQLNEKKALIYFASGLQLNGTDNQAQLHATVDAAIRSGVSFWPVDARGLVAGAPLGDATQGSPGGASMYTGTAAQAVQSAFQKSQDTLYALAGDTGGKALFDNNDLTRGIVQAQQAITDYYILEYYTSNPVLDGRFRKIKVTVASHNDAKLEFRQGYYAGKEFAKFNVADKERQLEDALMLEDPVTELTIAMEINYFQLNRAEYFVPIVVKIPGRELALAKRGGADHTLIDFVGEIKDIYGGTTVTNVRDNVNIKLTDATAAELAHRPIEYDAGFTLLPGKYMIKFLARDDETGRIGTYQTTFVIPNLNKEEKRVPISSVVLSSQRVDYKDALYNSGSAKDQAKAAAVNPLVIDGKKLIPSVTRVFNKGRDLFVYLQSYEQAATTKPIVAFVSLYKDGVRSFETQPIAVTPTSSTKLEPVPLSFSIGLGALPAGQYDCQISVLDPTSQKGTFWQGQILLSAQ